MGFVDICKDITLQSTAGDISSKFTGAGMDWLPLVLVGLAITVGFLVVLYMLGNFMRNAKLLAWVQSELFQVFATGMLASLIMALILGTCNFPADILSGSAEDAGRSIYAVADSYIDWGVLQGVKVFGLIISANFFVGLTSGFYFAFDPLGVGSRLSPMGAFSQISNIMYVMMSTFMVSFLVFATQKLIIEYIVLAMTYFFLPLGLIMRALSPTREFGGAMVGLALGMLIFYPLLVVFNKTLVQGPMEREFDKMSTDLKNLDVVSVLSQMELMPKKMLVGGIS
ncbi:hypothetical protein J4441_04250, partial [Candidatus Micrarchaeota archaeon]|nr:hypothetical protein [Candidatus Micrarchaeota archaeon]